MLNYTIESAGCAKAEEFICAFYYSEKADDKKNKQIEANARKMAYFKANITKNKAKYVKILKNHRKLR